MAPRLGIARFICDLVSTGATLDANGLAPVADVFDSEAVLIRSLKPLDAAHQDKATSLLTRIEGVISTQESKYIVLNAPESAFQAISAILPGAEVADRRAARRTARPCRGPGGLPGIGVLGDARTAEARRRVGHPGHADRKDDAVIRFDWSDSSVRATALARPRGRADLVKLASVRSMLDEIRADGWDALVRHASAIDGAAPELLRIAPFAAVARQELPPEAQAAMRLAADQIRGFHEQTLPEPVTVETRPGLRVSKLWRPLDRAGLYVPGGRARLFSTLMMLAIPAQVAGVRELVLVTPPRPSGGLDPAIALAAELCGIETIWTVGGAQAIGALAYGAGGISAVDRICGPGNVWVSAAKAMVSSETGGPGIDLPAGPSELMVLSGPGGNSATIAADLLSQAEHAPDAQVLVVSSDVALLNSVGAEVGRQLFALTGDFAPVRAIRCADLDQAFAIANAYAPEHLSLACDETASRIDDVRNAGAVFVGATSAESFGDYLAGSSHVLPTDGAARFTGGVSTLTFLKAMTVQRISLATAAGLAAPAAALARLEGLEAHARAAEARLP